MKLSRKMTRIIGFMFGGLFLILSYQNCSSNIDFQSTDQGQHKAKDGVTVAPPENADPDKGMEEDQDRDDNEHADMEDPEHYLNICKKAEKYVDAKELAPGASLVKERGNHIYKASALSLLSRISGNLLIFGQVNESGEYDGVIEEISDSNGNMIICNMSVAAVKGFTRGNMVIVNGDVGDVSGFTGNMLIIGGEVVGEAEDIRGRIIMTPMQ